MSKKLTNKFLLFTMILVILASVLFISVVSTNNTASADEIDDEIEATNQYQEIHVDYQSSDRVWGKTVLVDFSTAPYNFYFGSATYTVSYNNSDSSHSGL